ncbi:hypothetical protein KC363_g97 [Hortaea werneckii]|nr:hypothetical protein KC363_g97 [Hortaea werneckii]
MFTATDCLRATRSLTLDWRPIEYRTVVAFLLGPRISSPGYFCRGVDGDDRGSLLFGGPPVDSGTNQFSGPLNNRRGLGQFRLQRQVPSRTGNYSSRLRSAFRSFGSHLAHATPTTKLVTIDNFRPHSYPVRVANCIDDLLFAVAIVPPAAPSTGRPHPGIYPPPRRRTHD